MFSNNFSFEKRMWQSEKNFRILYQGLSDSKKLSELYVGDGKRKIMLLAMHYVESQKLESDTNRINAFLDDTSDDWSVCSVDLSGSQNSYGHISSNFKTMRGINGIIKSIQNKHNPSPEPKIIALDYFWLQNPIYYTERYGEDWPEKSQVLFTAFKSLIAIILPIDDFEPSSMIQQMQRIRSIPSLTFFTITKDDPINPLVYYTLQSNDKDHYFADRSHSAQRWRISGFVVLHRNDMTENDVKKYIKPNAVTLDNKRKLRKR